MKKELFVLILSITWLCSYGQRSNSKKEKIAIESEIVDSTVNNNREQSLINKLEQYIYTDTTYASANGKGITIQNSFPKGGSIEPDRTQYFDSSGKEHGFTGFWTRIINETAKPLELDINFPADSFPIFTPPDSYLKLFLPTETITFDKLSQFNYGLTELKSYFDKNFNKPTKLKKTINPNEEHIFYVLALSYHAGGTPRGGLILKGQDLYYRMSIKPHGYGIIACGKLAFKTETGN
tara:strand:- start:716 stop:1426 length:711 start_codon:yes stop_codon:yes gene_type:complete